MNYKMNNTSVFLDEFTSLLVSFLFENRSDTLYTGRSFWCFVEFFVCEYAGCNQPATVKRFEW